ncbi:MAG: hypothetical protein HY270_23565 [Deltaproteobacteria bacterium]|nr:hypothetical protein [Deltaproteobacteria bacterium]
MQRKLKRLVALLVIVTVFGVGIAKPRPVRADTTRDIIIGLVGFAAYIGIIVIVTKFVFKQDDSEAATVEDPLATYERNGGDVRVLQKCHQESGGLTLACW